MDLVNDVIMHEVLRWSVLVRVSCTFLILWIRSHRMRTKTKSSHSNRSCLCDSCQKVHMLAFCKGCGHHREMGFLCVKCNNRTTMYTLDRTDGRRPQIFKYNTDLEDEDYVPTESQSNVEYQESMQDLMTEAKELWDRVWAYCADCGERGDVYL